MSEYLLATHGLTKQFGHHKAVDHVDLHVKKGSIYGFIGRNGAGKTTFLKMISGLSQPTSGEIEMFGYKNAQLKNVRSRISCLIESPGLYGNMSAYDNLAVKCRLFGINDKRYIENILKTVGLSNVGKKKTKHFSLGMKQRLGIAQAIVGEPKVLIFDEPTAGLDAKERIRFRNVISSLANDKIVILATHIVTDIAFIAKNVVLIDGGKMISCASQSELCNEIYGKVWEVLTDYETGMELMRTKRVSNVISEDDRFNVRVVSDEKPHPDAVNVQPALEDVCIYHFGEIGE